MTARSYVQFLLKADVEGGFHVLIGGNSGVGKTLTILDYLEHTGEEKYVYQAKTFSAQTSARALQAFFEEKLEKIRKNLLGISPETRPSTAKELTGMFDRTEKLPSF